MKISAVFVICVIALLVVNTESQSDGIPEFNPKKINLSYPSEFMEPARKLVDRISIIIGDLMQNTAERFENFFVTQLKPLFRVSWFPISKN